MNNEESPILNRTHSTLSNFLHNVLDPIASDNFLEHNKFDTEFKSTDKYFFTIRTEKKSDGIVYFYFKRSLAVKDMANSLQLIQLSRS